MSTRYYNPEVGRFLNADALFSTGQGLLGNNTFSYCNNNPVIFADKSGTACQRTICDVYGGYAFSATAVAGGGVATSVLLDLLEDLVESIKKIVKSTKEKVGKNKSAKGEKNGKSGKTGKNGKKGQQPEPPNVKFPGNDPTKAPEGYEWKGPDPQGGKNGGYKNPNGKDSWHPDLNHPQGVDPHWDYNDGYGHKWRVFSDRIEFVK